MAPFKCEQVISSVFHRGKLQKNYVYTVVLYGFLLSNNHVERVLHVAASIGFIKI